MSVKFTSWNLAAARVPAQPVSGAGYSWAAWTVGIVPFAPSIIVEDTNGDQHTVDIDIPIVHRGQFKRLYLTHPNSNGTLWLAVSDSPCDTVAPAAGFAATSPEWIEEGAWPGRQENLGPGSVLDTYFGWYNGMSVSPRLWAGGASGAAHTMQVYREVICGEWDNDGQHICAQMPINMPLTTRPPISVSERNRVCWDSFLIAHSGLLPVASEFETGVEYNFRPGVVQWMNGGTFGYGLYLSTAGVWRFCSNNVLGLPPEEDTALTWPRAITEWVKVDVVHYAATPTLNARLRIYLDDVLVLSRDWEAGTTLPAYVPAANAIDISRQVRSTPAGGQIMLAEWYTRKGRFDKDGIPQ